MLTAEIIRKKRDRGVLTAEEIRFLVKGYVDGTVPDYQMAALLMAVWFNGMNEEETYELTMAMMHSGDSIDLSSIPGVKVDKHSTGGVADTTTLVALPLVAACGGRIAKMSGRGLGHTGGTLDKLESIPGFSVSQRMQRFVDIVREHGLSVIGQTGDLVPADKMLYALRDVTATIDNISLIASSIMSKKLAAGSDAIVLDVKTGSGAFMKSEEDAVALARIMVGIGKRAGKTVSAVVSDMSQPLGEAVGNALEVREAVEILQGHHGDGDLARVSLILAARMLKASGVCSLDEAEKKLTGAVNSGAGLDALKGMITAQGGDPKICDDTSLLPRAKSRLSVEAAASGYIASMETDRIGIAALLLGAGRRTKKDEIDPAVGLWMKKRLGDQVEEGEPIADFYVNDEANLEEAVAEFQKAVKIEQKKPVPPKLVRTIIEE
ncbi:pyrimidine-nucleoside phosphorylase [Marispirochaeta sp.]|uniref:pyrimidine-nucleoside phosphorylase n=1 Tax=Marispirochaeta sp. TaxID=2038653 RepID=UPI0029C862B7|nr:pyrimidine-nucleoside phosphorylase [Marispirochaeta sp.]